MDVAMVRDSARSPGVLGERVTFLARCETAGAVELGAVCRAGLASPVDSLNPFDSLESQVCARPNDVSGFQAFFLAR
jgi:hypothetical protein